MLRKLDETAIKGRTKRLYKDLIANRITISRIGNPPEEERGRPATNATTTDCPRSAGSSDRSVLAMQTMGTILKDCPDKPPALLMFQWFGLGDHDDSECPKHRVNRINTIRHRDQILRRSIDKKTAAPSPVAEN